MTLRDTVRTDISGRLARSRLTGLLGWDVQESDPDDLSGILDYAFRMGIDHDSETQALAAGQLALWRAVREGLILAYDFSADQESYKRSQIADRVETLIKDAEREARAVGVDILDSPPVVVSAVTYQTPYSDDRPLIYAERILRPRNTK